VGGFTGAAFQRSAFQGSPAFQTGRPQTDPGSHITGGTFARKRWRKMQQEHLDAIEAAERARERIEARARAAAAQKAADARAAMLARHEAERIALAQVANERLLQNARQAEMAQAQLSSAAQRATIAAAEARRREIEQDEEDAIILLLTSED
jgi:hypothetical protein